MSTSAPTQAQIQRQTQKRYLLDRLQSLEAENFHCTCHLPLHLPDQLSTLSYGFATRSSPVKSLDEAKKYYHLRNRVYSKDSKPTSYPVDSRALHAELNLKIVLNENKGLDPEEKQKEMDREDNKDRKQETIEGIIADILRMIQEWKERNDVPDKEFRERTFVKERRKIEMWVGFGVGENLGLGLRLG